MTDKIPGAVARVHTSQSGDVGVLWNPSGPPPNDGTRLYTEDQMRAAVAAGWQPIETAPVATNLLLVWRPIDHDDRPFHRSVMVGSLLYNDRGRQSGVAFINGMEYDVATYLTHWAPLPELPPARESLPQGVPRPAPHRPD